MAGGGGGPPTGAAGGDLSGNFPNPEIDVDAVGSNEIAANAVGSSEIAAGAVGSSEIGTAAVGSDEIAADAVGASEIATDAVGSAEIAANAVNTAEIANDAVTLDKIAQDGAATGDLLQWDGTDWVHVDYIPSFKGFTSAVSGSNSQTIASGSSVVVDVFSEDADPEGWFNDATGRFTPGIEGYYQVNAQITILSVTDGSKMIVQLYKNGSREVILGRGVSGGTDYNGYGGSHVVYMNGTTDYLEILAYQNTGSNQTIGGTDGYSSFSAFLIGN